MTLDEMKLLYTKAMGEAARMDLTTSKSFTLRVWDGMDGVWCDVVSNVDLGFALREWCKQTADGTKATCYDDIDYYKIFPSDKHLLYSGGFTMFRDNDDED